MVGPTLPSRFEILKLRVNSKPHECIYRLGELEWNLAKHPNVFTKTRQSAMRSHLEYDYWQAPARQRLDCRHPVAFIDTDWTNANTHLMVECRETNVCFSRDEMLDSEIPTLDELLAARDAVREGWSKEEADERHCRWPEETRTDQRIARAARIYEVSTSVMASSGHRNHGATISELIRPVPL